MSNEIATFVESGNSIAVKKYLQFGVDPNFQQIPNVSFSLLHKAAVYGRKEIVELLIEAGGNVNIKGDRGLTPLMLVALQCNKDLMSGDEMGDEMVALSKRAKQNVQNCFDIITMLLDAGANINQQDNTSGVTSLHCAVTCKYNEALVYFLLSRGVDPNLDTFAMQEHGENNVRGATVLKQAIFCSTPRIVEALLQGGGDIHKCHNDERTSLELALIRGDLSIIKLLLQHGALRSPFLAKLLHMIMNDGGTNKYDNIQVNVLDCQSCVDELQNKVVDYLEGLGLIVVHLPISINANTQVCTYGIKFRVWARELATVLNKMEQL